MIYAKPAIVMVAAFCAALIVSCGGGSELGSVDSLLDVVPRGTDSFLLAQLEELRDEGLDDLVDELAEMVDADMLEDWEIDFDDITSLVISEPNGRDSLTVLRGFLPQKDIEEALDDDGFRDDKFQGTDIWTKRRGDVALAFLAMDVVVIGEERSVERSIDVSRRGGQWLQGDEEFKDILDTLERALVYTVSDECEFRGCKKIASGVALEARDWMGVAVFSFRDQSSASDAERDVERSMEDLLDDLDLSEDGSLIVVTGEFDEKALALDRRGLVFGSGGRMSRMARASSGEPQATAAPALAREAVSQPAGTVAPTLAPAPRVAPTLALVSTRTPGFQPTAAPAAVFVPTPTPLVVQKEAPVATPTPVVVEQKVRAPTRVAGALGAKYGGTIRMASYGEPNSWDPSQSSSAVNVAAYSQLYNQLLQFDNMETYRIEPDLVHSWEVNNSGDTWTFRLREDAFWANGGQITAADVAYTMGNLYMQEGSTASGVRIFQDYVATNQVTAIDRYTVQFRLSQPVAAFLPVLVHDFMKVLPAHSGIFGSGERLRHPAEIMSQGAMSGPYVLSEYNDKDFWSLERNQGYFKDGLPFADAIIQYIIPEPASLMAALLAGQIDMINSAHPRLASRVASTLASDPNLRVHSVRNINVGLMVNRKMPHLSDPRVREAIYLAIDRHEVNNVSESSLVPGVCPMLGFGHDEFECATWMGLRAKNSAGGRDDITQAQRLMAEAGYPDGFETRYDARTGFGYEDVCSVIRNQLAGNLGIIGELNFHESRAGWELYRTSRPVASTGDWELACQGVSIPVFDPDSLLGDLYRGGGRINFTDWDDDTIRRLDERQRRELNPDSRREILKEIEMYLVPTTSGGRRRVSEALHWIPLSHKYATWVLHQDVKGFNTPPTMYSGLKHEDLWLDR